MQMQAENIFEIISGKVIYSSGKEQLSFVNYNAKLKRTLPTVPIETPTPHSIFPSSKNVNSYSLSYNLNL